MAHVAVILSGCGVFDGAEIHEAVCSLLALDKAGISYQCVAPNRPQMHVIDHLAGAPAEGQERNVLVESARIARGNIKDIAALAAADFDAVLLPGGFGAAKNLSTFAVDGADCQVDEGVTAFLQAARAAGKPIAALCIAPVILAKLFGPDGAQVTIGNDADTAAAIAACGATHVDKAETEIVVDEQLQLVTSPCYMYEASISEIAVSAEAVVAALQRMMQSS